MATLLPLPDAAAHLGLSQSALRRRLRAGAVRGERRPTPSGFAWWVEVDDGPTPTATRRSDAGGHPDGSPPPSATREPAAPQEPPGTALAGQRAADMAAYTERLLAPYVAQIAELSEKVGRLEAEVAAATANGQADHVDHLNLRATGNGAAPASWPERRRWWQRLLWG